MRRFLQCDFFTIVPLLFAVLLPTLCNAQEPSVVNANGRLLGPEHRFNVQNWTQLIQDEELQLKIVGREQDPFSASVWTGSVLPGTLQAIDGVFNSPIQDVQTGSLRRLQEQMLQDPFAQYALGIQLQRQTSPNAVLPLGVGFDDIRQSADRGVVPAQIVVDKTYLNLTDSLSLWGSAQEELEAELLSGSALGAENVLAQYFQYGFGGPVDLVKSEQYWVLASSRGNPVSVYGYGNFLLEQGRFEDAVPLIQQAAAQNYEDGAIKHFDLALMGVQGTDFHRAEQKLLSLANFGSPLAAIRLGDYYAAMTPPDIEAAASFYRLAANSDSGLLAHRSMGAGRLGLLYLHNRNVIMGATTISAIRLLNSAASNGDPIGLIGLAEYALERGDFPRAYRLSSRAAELGDMEMMSLANSVRNRACLADDRLKCMPIPVFFATTRKPDATSHDRFGRSEADENALSVGVVFTNVSSSDATLQRRQLLLTNAFEILDLLGENVPTTLELTSAEDKVIILSAAPSDFVEAIQAQSEQNGLNDIFVFVHGFNVPFGSAVRLAAETSEKAGIPSIPFALSWPSRGNLGQYTADLGAISTACPPLQEVFGEIGDTFHGSHVTLMAHSMGSQLAVAIIGGCRGLGQLAWNSSEKIGSVIYAAADISQTDFKQTFSIQRAAAMHITMYVSGDDLALRTASSWGVNNTIRAGQGGDGVRLLIMGLETVDATTLPFAGGDFVNHGYVFSRPEIVSDLNLLLNGNLEISSRRCLERRSDPQQNLPFLVVVAGCN